MAIAGALHPMSSGPKPPVQIILTSGTSWTVPNDWNNADNKVECIGAGAKGTGTNGGGGGGAYSMKNNVPLSPGASVSYQIGTPSTSQSVADTWLGSPTTVKAAGAINMTGGAAASCVGDVKYSGGTTTGYYQSGGGGAAGPNGDGSGSAGDRSSGGAADAGFGGAGSAAGSGLPGGNGTEWGTAGSGGGAGGYLNGTAGAGGLYGGGGGGSNTSNGNGAPGVIVITYTPV